MTPEAQRIAIAEACGWKIETHTYRAGCWISPEGKTSCRSILALPDYLGDLNAIHEAEKKLTDQEHDRFRIHLYCAAGKSSRKTSSATAAQRAEAFRHTLNLWNDNL